MPFSILQMIYLEVHQLGGLAGVYCTLLKAKPSSFVFKWRLWPVFLGGIQGKPVPEMGTREDFPALWGDEPGSKLGCGS